MMKSYFLPINSMCLAHYFGCACIKPAKYFANKPEDIQNRFNKFLLFTSKVEIQEEDCCLEILLNSDEEKYLVPISDSWVLYKSFLPISRVKKICFSSEEQKRQTITNISMSTAFVPKRMICGNSKVLFSNDSSHLSVTANENALDLTEQIRKYDRFLGALAVMRVAREDYMNVSENYVATLSFFNKEIEKQLQKNKRQQIKLKYSGLFNNNDPHFNQLLPYLNKDIKEEDLEKIAREERQSVKKDAITKVINLSNLDHGTYIIAFLYSFGVGSESKKKKIDSIIISNFHAEDVRAERGEVLALCYGYNRGYSAFNNSYSLSSSSSHVDVKFCLDNKLDLYAIESVYNYIINSSKPIEKIDYINDLIPHKGIKAGKNEYVILDTLIVDTKSKKKVLSPEWWNSFFQKSYGKIYDNIKALCLELGGIDKFRPFIQNIVEDIHKDIVEEVKDMYSSQIEELKSQLEKAKDNNACLNAQRQELKAKSDLTKPVIVKQQELFTQSEVNGSPTDMTLSKNTNFHIDETAFVEKVLQEFKKVNAMSNEELKTELKSRGLKPGKQKENLGTILEQILTSTLKG